MHRSYITSHQFSIIALSSVIFDLINVVAVVPRDKYDITYQCFTKTHFCVAACQHQELSWSCSGALDTEITLLCLFPNSQIRKVARSEKNISMIDE